MAARCATRSCTQLASSTSSSAARAFLLLTSKRHLHSTQPLLDFLLPSVPTTAIRHGRINGQAAFPARKQVTRGFTTTSRRQQTTAIINPRQNDDGSDMVVEITPRASNRLKQIMTKDSNPNLALRIQVESGGCHGFQYLMSLTTLPPPENPTPAQKPQKEASPALNTSSSDPNAIPAQSFTSSPFPGSDTQGKEGKLEEDDTVFAADDGSGAKIVMDGPSLELLQGSKVDFTMELIGSQFKIVDNPKATSSCGCGTSFDIKM